MKKIYHVIKIERDALVWLLPFMFLYSIISFCYSSFIYFNINIMLIADLYSILTILTSMIPYVMTMATSIMLAIYHQLNRPAIAILHILYLSILLGTLPDSMKFLSILIGITLPFFTTPFITLLLDKSRFNLLSLETLDENIIQIIKLIFPALVVLITEFTLIEIFKFLCHNIFSIDIKLTDFISNNFLYNEVIYTFYNSFLWFVGIHGYYALLPYLELLQYSVYAEYTTTSYDILSTFVFLGGCGATLSLALALIIFSPTKRHRLLGITSIPLGFFNINELLLFALPIIFNKKLLIPFILTPISNLLITHTALYFKIITIKSTFIPFISPLFVNGWLITGGDFNAILLQLFSILLGIFIYAPFVKTIFHDSKKEDIFFRSLNTSFSQRSEELLLINHDEIEKNMNKDVESVTLLEHLHQLKDYDFYLEFQPQINLITQHVDGCEALIRAINHEGKILSPIVFLPWFEKAKLQTEIDRWVFDSALKASIQMETKNCLIPISINVYPESLLDKNFISYILSALRECEYPINIELIENTFIEESEIIQKNLLLLKNASKIKVYIDDFGTGYSSLSYLNKFDIDTIKLDKSFVDAIQTEKGKLLFNALCLMIDSMNISLIIEGVENKTQLELMPKNSSIQGWYFSKSLNIDDFILYVVSKNNCQ